MQLVLRVQQETMETTVLKETLVRPEPKVTKVIQERKVLQDLLVQLEFKVRKVKLETKEIPVQLVRPEPKATRATKVKLVLRVQ